MQDTRNYTSLPSSPIMTALGTMSAYRKKAIMPCHLFDVWTSDEFLVSEFTFGGDGDIFWKQTKKKL